MLASGHWPVPLKQLVQISVQKLIKEVFWSVEHQIIQQFSYLPKKHQSPGCIHKEEWVSRELVWLVRSCTTELYKQLYHHQLYKRHRHKHVAIQQVPDFFIWKPTLLWTLHVRTSNRSTLRILGGSSHPGLLRRRLTKWIHRELWIVNLHVSIKYWDILLLANQLQAATNSNIVSGLKNLELVNLTPMNAQLWVQHTSSR